MRSIRLFAVVLAIVAAALKSSVAMADADKIRVAIPVQALFFMPLFVAQDEGIFKKHNLEVEVISTNGDGPDIDALSKPARDELFHARAPKLERST